MGVVAELTYSKGDFDTLASSLQLEASEIVSKTLNDLVAVILTSFSEGKSGAIYKRGTSFHQASAPGEPPAIDYGDLANSIFQAMTSKTSGYVGTDSDHAGFMEDGTTHIAPRPFMAPAAEEVGESFEAAIQQLKAAVGAS